MTFDVRLHAYEPGGGSLGFLPEPLSQTVSVVNNDNGALALMYSTRTVGGGILARGLEQGLEVAVEVSNGGSWVEPKNARYLLITRRSDLADDAAVQNLTLPSYGWLLSKARNLDTANLLPEDHTEAGKRPFYSEPAGVILGTLLDENAARNGVPVTRGWDSATDSAGAAWSKVATLYYELGLSLDVILANLAAQGMADWRTDGRTLHLYNADSPATSADRSESVRLWLGTDVTDAPSDESLEDVVSRVLIRGDGGLVITEDNPSAPTPWGKWEGYISQGGVTEEGTARTLVQADLERGARVRGQYTRTLLLTGEVKYAPLIDYTPGEWITAPTTGTGERVRVQQVTITKDANGVSGSVVLNDRIVDAELRRARRIQGITGGSSAAGADGGSTRPAQDGPDRRTPAAPDGLVVDSDAYIDTDGAARGVLTATWDAVTTATDATVLDVVGYDVAIRENVTGAPWRVVLSTDDVDAAYSPVDVGADIAVKVRARGKYTTVPGVWSGVEVVTIADDTTPPPAPSDPVLTTRLGTVTVTWDGLTDTGAAMPRDLARVDVYRAGEADPIGSLLPGQGTQFLVVTGLPYDQAQQFQLVAVDRSGNASSASTWIDVTTTPLVDTDLIGEVVHDANLVDVDGSKIHPGSIETTRLQVGTDNLIADHEFIDPDIRAARAARAGVSFVQDADGWHAELVAAATSSTLMLGTTAEINTDTEGLPWLPVDAASESNPRYTFFADVANDGSEDSAIVLRVNLLSQDGSTLATQTSSQAVNSTTYQRLEFPLVLSGNYTKIAVGVRRVGPEGGVVKVKRVGYWRLMPGVLIQDGAVTAGKIAALAVEAGKIAANAVTADTIDAGAVTASKVAANAIETSQLAADAITAKHTLTAATIQSSVFGDNPRVLLNQNGLFMYDESGTLVVRMQTSTGLVRIAGEYYSSLEESRGVRISHTLQSGRPGAEFHTGIGYQAQPKIFSEDGTAGSGPNNGASWPAGTLVLTSAENTLNSTGRADLALKRGGDFQLRQNWGTHGDIGIVKQGYAVSIRGAMERTYGTGVNDHAQLYIRTVSRSIGGTSVYTSGPPRPVGTVRPFVQPIGAQFHFGSITGIASHQSDDSFAAGCRSDTQEDNGSTIQMDMLICWAE